MTIVTVAAPLCAPSRAAITGQIRRQLAPYQFRLGRVDAAMVRESGKPVAWNVDIDFADVAAEWGEYVLLRYGYARVGPCLNAKNTAWAERYTTQPEGPWYGPGCKDRPRNVPAGSLPNANPPPAWRERARQPKTSRPTIGRLRRLWWRLSDLF